MFFYEVQNKTSNLNLNLTEENLCNACTVIHINYFNAYTAIDPKSVRQLSNLYL